MGIFSKHRIFCGKDGKLHDEAGKEVQPISDPVFDMIESSMLDQHVYCTACQNYGCTLMDNDEYELHCKHKDECDFYDPEDSKPLRERPFYESSFWLSSFYSKN